MTVVTDTSVVLNLCVIGQQELLRDLFGNILAPTVVVTEFQRLASVVRGSHETMKIVRVASRTGIF